MPRKLRLGLILQGDPSWMGGVEYSKNLVKALYQLPPEQQSSVDLVLYLAHGNDDLFADMPARFSGEVRRFAPAPFRAWRRIGARLAPRLCGTPNRLLLEQARRQGIDFLFPFNPLPGDVPRMASAGWLADFQHEYFPAFFPAKELEARHKGYAQIARDTPCLVVSSRSVERDFRRFHPAHAHKAYVISFRTVVEDGWLAGDAGAAARERRLPDRFFLLPNQFWQHKNHGVVFQALGILRQRGTRPAVVCTGHLNDYRRPAYADEWRRMLQDLQIAEQVHLLGLVPRSAQIQLFRRSLAVLQPSLFEGWSTVVEDARALGKTMAVSDIEVHREQDPPHAVFFDPHDALRLASLLEEWWSELPPGPDRDREELARVNNRRQVQAYGQRFLDLARTAAAQAA
jgi:glycosyltransferase involved in cell wall biosynthesis